MQGLNSLTSLQQQQQQHNSNGNPLSSLFDSQQSQRTPILEINRGPSFQVQLNEMNQSAIKMGALILKLENLIETNPAFKTGDQAALMQMSLVKEQHFALNDQIQKLNSTLGSVEQEMREDLDHQKNLKLEVATYFGKPRTFFDCLSTPGSEGHTRIYQFIKRLYSQLESLRVINAMPSATSTATTTGAG